MRVLKLSVVAGMALALAACPDRTRDDTAVTTTDQPTVAPTEAPTHAIPAGAERVELEPQAGGMVAGEVGVAARNGNTHVTLILRNAPANESVGARLMSGTCQNPGVEIARLDAVSTDDMGQGHSETNVGHDPNLILDGNHIAAVFAPGTEPERDRPIACATLPQHGMAQQPGAAGATGTTGTTAPGATGTTGTATPGTTRP